jgi:aminoglycoside/choline kinase family phosphotransferase
VLSWSESFSTTDDTMSERLDRARQWVQNILGVQSVDLQPASADASFRRYFRFSAEGSSLILMDAPTDREDCRPYIAVSELLEHAGIHVPIIHARDLDAGFLLLEDLGQRCYLDELDTDSAPALYGDALGALLAMQSRVPADAIPEFDTARVFQELSLFGEWFLHRHLGIDTTGKTGEVLSTSCQLLVDRFAGQARVFVHRDYHSRNLMRTLERNPGVLDFQDAVAGPATYDAISLLRDVYIEWPRERVETWLLEYHEGALCEGIPITSDAAGFLRDADLIGAQRHLKIAGIFCRLYYRDGKSDYLRDIPLTLRYLMDECGRQPELAALGDLLEELDVMRKLQECNMRSLGDARAPGT